MTCQNCSKCDKSSLTFERQASKSPKYWISPTPTAYTSISTKQENKMTTISFPNSRLGYATLSTDHAASSYGIPVLVDENGNAYGPSDMLPTVLGLEWLNPMYGIPENSPTAGDLVRAHVLEGFDGGSRSSELIEAAKLFISVLTSGGLLVMAMFLKRSTK